MPHLQLPDIKKSRPVDDNRHMRQADSISVSFRSFNELELSYYKNLQNQSQFYIFDDYLGQGKICSVNACCYINIGRINIH